ncbi:hypothetical protein [Pseudodesulfovibrio sediminis]|uniref:Phage protein n=1 Tax=Pseudodesulfovibrio sediminis TaxID=2810563 RepID=A0ABN6ETI6_9BACT|nr:hypothetical protein [Pseudodesulfovibrio sediminis]BCS89652.1 hypothetical protein PSDVSF_28940 [Pseudodesulfovibrio sediminis]
MYIEMDQTLVTGEYSFEMHLNELAHEQADKILGDMIELSDEAITAFEEAAIEPIRNGSFSLEQIEQRINVVRGEIAEVWNSALPDEEKYRQIATKENEIALLQAGQFTFAKAGLSKTV